MQTFLFISLVVAGVAVEIHEPSARADDMRSTMHKGLMRSEPTASKPEIVGISGSTLVQDGEHSATSADPQQAQALETSEKAGDSNMANSVQANEDEVDEEEDEDEDEDDDLPNATKKCCGNTTSKQVTLVAQSKDSNTIAKLAAQLSADAKILARDEKNKLGDMKQAAALLPKKDDKTTITPCRFGRGPNVTKTTLGCGGRLQVQAKLNADDRSVAMQKMKVKNGIRSLREATREMISDRKFVGESRKLTIGKVSKDKKWSGGVTTKEIRINNAVAKLALKLVKDATKLEKANLAKLQDSSGCGNATSSLKKASTTDDKVVDKNTVTVDNDITKISKLSSAGKVAAARHTGSR